MKIQIGNLVRDMTDEEVARYNAVIAQASTQEVVTTEERLDEIESAMMELATLLGGESDG